MLNVFYDIIYTAFNYFVPKVKTKKPKFPLWYSTELKKLIFQKKIAHIRYKTSYSNQDYMTFSQLRNDCKEAMNDCYNEYISNMENSMKENSTVFWKYVNSKHRNYNLPNTMSYNGESTSNVLDMANFLADFFASVYSDKNNDINECIAPNSISIGNIEINEIDIFNGILNLKNNLSSGTDDVSVLFLKNCKYILSHILSIIFNKSLLSGTFPDFWKISYITPLHKSGNKSDVTNYRAISKFSLISKLLEMIVSNKITPKIQGILAESQHGFVKGRSTVTNLLVYEQALIESLEAKHQIDSIYTDFKKAFDKVIHGILIKKLESLGIFGNLLKWFNDYLTGRTQYVKIKNVVSKEIKVLSGVPQGGHLSPLLFNVYVNDIQSVLRNSEVILSYADDLKFFSTITSVDDCEKIQEDLNNLHGWCNDNGMELNVNKCKVMQFYRKKETTQFNYQVNDVNLEKVNVIKDLGVYFDREMSFNDHIDYITNKALKMLGFLKRTLRDFNDIGCFKALYFSYIRSSLEYACQIWSPYYKINVECLERVQKRFLRFVGYKLGINVDQINYRELMKSLNIFPLEQRRNFIDICTLYKIVNHHINCPQLLEKINIKVPQRNLRDHDLLSVDFHRTNYGKRSSLGRFASLHNKHCKDLDMFNNNINTFKNKLKKGVFYIDLNY